MLPQELTLYLPDGSPNGLPLHLRLIPACPQGFLMGSRDGAIDQRPRHRVVIHDGFYLGETVVTQAQFRTWTNSEDYALWLTENHDAFEDSPPKPHVNYHPHNDNYPAENMTWHEAQGFLHWLSEAVEIPEGLLPCLPTEAWWEYACRARTDSDTYSGDGEAALDAVAWHKNNSENTAHPVADRGAANAFGLYDMHGLVWEWCQDVWDPKAYLKKPDGVPADAVCPPSRRLESRVVALRGGSWYDRPEMCMSASRYRRDSKRRNGIQGFRICLKSDKLNPATTQP